MLKLVSSTRSLNQVQTIPQIKIAGTSIIVGTVPVVLYTVPPGKKAVILACSDRSVNFGANTSQQMTVAANNLRVMANNEPNLTSENINGAVIVAGDTITLVGNNINNNGTIIYFISIQESPL